MSQASGSSLNWLRALSAAFCWKAEKKQLLAMDVHQEKERQKAKGKRQRQKAKAKGKRQGSKEASKEAKHYKTRTEDELVHRDLRKRCAQQRPAPPLWVPWRRSKDWDEALQKAFKQGAARPEQRRWVTLSLYGLHSRIRPRSSRWPVEEKKMAQHEGDTA